ncbi:MAG TPA: S-layer homology domain-containing protein [Thermoanaerobaculia bacterium]|nr:S-layer homology domain-containing protein [Thermoanaerobaculia bacterium]
MASLFAPLLALLALVAGSAGALLGTCGPFTDVAADAFCPFVLEIFYLGITTGTTATTYDPTANVSRLQMAAFLSRTVDGVLKRGSRRAALDQFWTTQNATVLGLTTAAITPRLVASDGADLWVACQTSGTVARIRASDGRFLETWTAATGATGVVSAMGRVLVNSVSLPKMYAIDPAQPAGAVTTVATLGGAGGFGITFDGSHVWTTNGASVSIVTPGAAVPWTVTTVTTGFGAVFGAIFDGNNVWVTDTSPPASGPSPFLPDGFVSPGTLVKLSASGAILQSVTVGFGPQYPAFDGSNIWVPNNGNGSVTVVRASNGAILQTLTAGIAAPTAVAFNGERILVAGGSTSVTLWKAADLSPLGSFPLGSPSWHACSDGISFWITLLGVNKLARF